MEEDFCDLTDTDQEKLRKVSRTPASALGTTRKELYDYEEGHIKAGAVDTVINVLKAHNMRYLFTIGGGDSAETAEIIRRGADEYGYDLRVIHIPKTIDNDLPEMDHCPGYGSAAKYNIESLIGTWFDARSAGNAVDLNVVMGRYAGWLAAAGAACRGFGYEPLIVTPENPMEIDEFAELVHARYKENGKLLQIVVSEGAKGRDGLWAETLRGDGGAHARADDIGRLVLSSVQLEEMLRLIVQKVTDKAKIIPTRTGYPQRCHLGVWSEIDYNEAYRAAQEAVGIALCGESGMVMSIQRALEKTYSVGYIPIELRRIAEPGSKMTRSMPPEFFDDAGKPNELFEEWLSPLLGEMPETAILDAHRVAKKYFAHH